MTRDLESRITKDGPMPGNKDPRSALGTFGFVRNTDLYTVVPNNGKDEQK